MFLKKLPFWSELVKRKEWNKQYRNGMWETLKSSLENARFEAVCRSIKKLGKISNIMEVGCGEGLLERKMDAALYTRFVGIDISNVAIQKARDLAGKKAEYLCVDMEKYTTMERFDVIIFNESLFYAREPVKLVNKYMQFLSPAKFMIASIYEMCDSRELINSVKAAFNPIDHIITSNSRGQWHCFVFDKTASGQNPITVNYERI